jgi:hypothetical protein
MAVNRTAGRIVTLTAYLTSLVTFAGYSGSLISSLAIQTRDLPFRDLQGLLRDGSYSLGVPLNSSMLNIFDVSSAMPEMSNRTYNQSCCSLVAKEQCYKPEDLEFETR